MGLITSLVENCSTNAEAVKSNSVDALNFFRALFAFAYIAITAALAASQLVYQFIDNKILRYSARPGSEYPTTLLKRAP